jgi:hypothetical protein
MEAGAATIRDRVRRQNAVTLNYQQGHLHKKSETFGKKPAKSPMFSRAFLYPPASVKNMRHRSLENA